ncbi:hypothetical protein WICPIJ_002515 [Wickerhamomyces pijperi]|uniref:Major facilitator superfamily (MFS) profile domain-containing protein n=1 Tax=Wickerhamomyces pijperi TaxID=599730 RepID=A0A9P8Q903_WICPI|nr:hypothetical protein WICPIJ_002515 [Wickerhamomyces pijperi]
MTQLTPATVTAVTTDIKDTASNLTLESNSNQLLEDLPLSHPLVASHERSLIRKLDLLILPVISLIYFLSNLDKSNIGNAYTSGLPLSLNLKGNEYGNVISLLFVTYTVFETPVALSLKRIGAKYALSFLVFAFGVVSIGTSFVTNYPQLLTCRILLGMFESGIIPIINVYLAMLYTKHELAKRTAVVYSASALAGAFGGLLAYGLIKINVAGSSWSDDANGSWRWLFAIEGGMTVLAVPLIWVFLPGGQLNQVWWVTKEERTVWAMRLQQREDFFQDDKFQWSEVLKSFTDMANVLVMLYEFCVDLTLVGISTFLPAIIKGMGTFDKYEIQLLTIPYYSLSFISFLVTCYLSDKYQHRGSFLLLGSIFEIIGYVILISTTSFRSRYAGCLVLSLGMYVCSSLSITWIQNNNAGHYKRATIGGMITTVGSLAGVLAGQIYTAESAPQYKKGLSVALGLSCLAFPLCLGMMGIYHYRNKKNMKKLQEVSVEDAGEKEGYRPKDDRDPRFKFIL